MHRHGIERRIKLAIADVEHRRAARRITLDAINARATRLDLASQPQPLQRRQPDRLDHQARSDRP